MSTANTKTYSAIDFVKYASVATDTDLIAARPGYTADGRAAIKPRRFLVEGAGNLVLKNAAGDDVIFVATAGQVIDVQATTMDASTSATNIIVMW